MLLLKFPVSQNSHFIHMMEKRHLGEGASDHTEERTEVCPFELFAKIPTAHHRETTSRSSASVQAAPTGSPVTDRKSVV